LNLERDFLVAYWEQRGCGDVPQQDAKSVSLPQQVDDLRSVLQWLYAETKQRVIALGISFGGSMVLRAVEQEADRTKAAVVVSPDAQTVGSDAYSYAFLQERARGTSSRRLRRRVQKLGPPPYVDTTAFQRRASLLADLGTIEYGRTF